MWRERTMTQCGCDVVMHPNRASGVGVDTSGDQQELSGAAARFEVLVGPLCVLERVAPADARVERAVRDPAQHLARPPFELLAGGRIRGEPGAGEVERLGLQAL